MHSCNTFGVRMSHGQTQTHKTHHGPDLGEATTFPLIVYYVPLHKAHIQMAFCPGTPKWESWDSQSWDSQMGVVRFPKLGLPRLWGHITLRADLQLRWSRKQSCSPHQGLSIGMLHATCTQENRFDSQLLVVRSQIGNLTPDLSFRHNLCFKCLNGSCEPILDI
jgi:hypothetical protein